MIYKPDFRIGPNEEKRVSFSEFVHEPSGFMQTMDFQTLHSEVSMSTLATLATLTFDGFFRPCSKYMMKPRVGFITFRNYLFKLARLGNSRTHDYTIHHTYRPLLQQVHRLLCKVMVLK